MLICGCLGAGLSARDAVGDDDCVADRALGDRAAEEAGAAGANASKDRVTPSTAGRSELQGDQHRTEDPDAWEGEREHGECLSM